MERKGRIPVAKFRTQEGKTRSRSRVREPDYNETDPETDLFTLLEDNIALKEDNKTLKLKVEEQTTTLNEIREENSKLKKDIADLRVSQTNIELLVNQQTEDLQKSTRDKLSLEKFNKDNLQKIDILSTKLKEQQENKNNLSKNFIESNVQLKERISKIFPTLGNTEMESYVDIENEIASNIVTAECIERILEEFSNMKSALNAAELQLYEANEKIADLVENQHHFEEETETLRMENTNLTRVAQLLTDNMKESVKTSKKMESALLKLKQRNDELTQNNKDLIDGPQSPLPIGISADMENELQRVQDELANQNKEHSERIVEMKQLVDAAIEKTTNDEIKVLQVKLEIMEKELQNALVRAENAEAELMQCKMQARNITNNSKINPNDIENTYQTEQLPPPKPLLPPPPPPPLPTALLYMNSNHNDKVTQQTLHDSIRDHNLKSGSTSSSSECNTQSDQQVEATGLDAIVREIKEGKVTLRRARRKSRTSTALQEMFQVLEISRKRNRNSQILIDMHI